jgi:hypothetical protein
MVPGPVLVYAGLQSLSLSRKQIQFQRIEGAGRRYSPEFPFIGYALGSPQQLRNRLQGKRNILEVSDRATFFECGLHRKQSLLLGCR